MLYNLKHERRRKEPRKPSPRKGHRIPDSTRKQIAAALEAGETGYHLAAKFGVSYNIVHMIKHELGMVRANKRTTKGRG